MLGVMMEEGRDCGEGEGLANYFFSCGGGWRLCCLV